MLICRENTKTTGFEVVRVDDGFSWTETSSYLLRLLTSRETKSQVNIFVNCLYKT